MPPSSGPAATAKPTVEPQTAIARPRSAPWYSAPISASAVANSAAPPTPCSARAASSAATFQAIPHRNDAALNTPTPIPNSDPPPVAVGERAGGQDQRRERDRVRVDDPLQPGQARAEPALDARQRDVHDRDVDQQHERRHADGEQRPAAARGGGGQAAHPDREPDRRRLGPNGERGTSPVTDAGSSRPAARRPISMP